MKSIIDELIKQKLLKLNQAQVWWAIIIKNAKFYLKIEQKKVKFSYKKNCTPWFSIKDCKWPLKPQLLIIIILQHPSIVTIKMLSSE